MKNSKHGVGLKILFIGIIVLILSIGLLVIRGLLSSREYTYRSAVNDISQSAGSTFVLRDLDVTIYGKHNRYSSIAELDIPIGSFDVEADLKTSMRHIGIYSAPVYTGQVVAKVKLNYENKDNDEFTYSPSQSLICLDTDNTNLTKHPIIKVNGTEYTADVIQKKDNKIGVYCPLVEGENDIEITMDIRGAETFMITPVGGQNSLQITCDWPSPGFTIGKLLPDYRDITDQGFTASWNIPFSSKDNRVGFRYVQSVDLYKLLERSITYGFLFIIVPFIVMFLFELFANVNLHPMNYLLCGAACIVFFLLLMAFSEHVSFTASYIIGSCGAAILVSAYLSSVTKQLKIGLGMMGSFIILYVYLFFSLKSEDYAFLIGAVFIFIILALVMFFTRNVDWSSLGKKKETLPLPDPAQS